MKSASELARRFGIPEAVLQRLGLLQDQDTVFAGTKEAMVFDALRPLRRGIRLCRVFPYSVKPTTFALQVLGRHATRNVVDVDEDAAKALINGGEVRIEAPVTDGFVLIRWRGFAVGIGHYRRPVLKSQIPRIRPVE
jgi:NOL1/NOP2/fmu family ribosome biogenesis protein